MKPEQEFFLTYGPLLPKRVQPFFKKFGVFGLLGNFAFPQFITDGLASLEYHQARLLGLNDRQACLGVYGLFGERARKVLTKLSLAEETPDYQNVADKLLPILTARPQLSADRVACARALLPKILEEKPPLSLTSGSADLTRAVQTRLNEQFIIPPPFREAAAQVLMRDAALDVVLKLLIQSPQARVQKEGDYLRAQLVERFFAFLPTMVIDEREKIKVLELLSYEAVHEQAPAVLSKVGAAIVNILETEHFLDKRNLGGKYVCSLRDEEKLALADLLLAMAKRQAPEAFQGAQKAALELIDFYQGVQIKPRMRDALAEASEKGTIARNLGIGKREKLDDFLKRRLDLYKRDDANEDFLVKGELLENVYRLEVRGLAQMSEFMARKYFQDLALWIAIRLPNTRTIELTFKTQGSRCFTVQLETANLLAIFYNPQREIYFIERTMIREYSDEKVLTKGRLT